MKMPGVASRKSKIILGAVIALAAVALITAYAYQSGFFLCRFNGGEYVGQAVDAEQAAAKLAAFAGGANRTNSPPLSYMVFSETRASRGSVEGWLNGQRATISGFVLDAPYKNGDKLVYGDGYLLSDSGNLYKLSSAGC